MGTPDVLTHVRCLAVPEVSPLAGVSSKRRQQCGQKRRRWQPPEATRAGLLVQKTDPDPPGAPRRHRRQPPAGPRRAVLGPGLAAPGSLGLINPGSPATSCPRSPNPSPGHDQGTSAPLRGLFCSVLVGGRGKSRQRGKKEQGLPPAVAADPPCSPKSVRAWAIASQPRAPRGNAGRESNGEPPGSPTSRARSLASRPSVPLRFSWAPQLAPPNSSLASLAAAAAEIFPQCNCRGRSFLAYGSRRCPIRRGGGGVQVGGRSGEAKGEARPR